jgi:hypothetical protein
MMRNRLLPFLLLAAAPASAQMPLGPAWHPANDYVTPGQDEPGYRRWVMMQPTRAVQVASFHRYLSDAGVGLVAPTWQLLRTASQWQRCGAQPFEVPPLHEWPNIVQTLRYVRDYVVPAIGAVEPVSAYRNPLLNHCAGGARESVHQHMSAIDMVPLYPTSRETMMRRLCAVHALEGPRYAVGLGFYTKMRFHVDSWKFRTWGSNDRGSIACAASYAIAHAPPPPPPASAAPPAAATTAETMQAPAPTPAPAEEAVKQDPPTPGR